MVIRKLFGRKKIQTSFVEPDEIFLDSTNLPEFDTQQFEGRIEKAITKQTIWAVGIFFGIVLCIFTVRLVYLQIVNGDRYFSQSQENRLDREPLFGERGVIYDRNNIELTWNEPNKEDETFSRRAYINKPGFGHLLGYVSYPSRDKSGVYWQSEFIGKGGIEKTYNDILSGVNGTRLIERDVHGKVFVSNQVNNPIPGENITLAIDSRIQEQFAKAILETIASSGYEGGAGMMMDIETGELLALTSIPEYNSNIVSDGSDATTINRYFTNKNKPFLNRALGGVYSPGSIVKPYIAMGALTEGVITPNTRIVSQGSISIPNPYNPSLPTIFKDYRPDNGIVDLRRALAVSSNIFFYNVSGGYQSQRGIGIDNIGKYARMFGIGLLTGIDAPNEKEGIIPSPQWKEKNFSGDPWRIGDTYNTAIGQYGFQVTPIEMLRAVGAIANDGFLVTPHLVKNDKMMEEKKVQLDLRSDFFQVVREGMRLVVSDPKGTAVALNSLPFKVAAKTGTAEVGANNQYINAWATGFFPYEKPRYAFVVLMERSTSVQSPGASSVVLKTLSWMAENTPEYVSLN